VTGHRGAKKELLMRAGSNFWIKAWVLGWVLGCGGSGPTPATPDSSPSSAETASAEPNAPSEPARAEHSYDNPPPGSSLERIMQAHFTDALLIRQAVIAGTPEQAANPATVLRHIRDLDKFPEGWQVFVEHMQQTAARITDSTTVAQAAGAAADLGVSCGLCHQRHGGPTPSNEPAPGEGKTLESRMRRHAWATERLWEGLYVPSESAWMAGAEVLTQSPFPDEVLRKGGVVARSAAGDFAKLASNAGIRKTVEDRAALYAEMLVTCGTCHQAVQRSP
jgi:cytochrome c553